VSIGFALVDQQTISAEEVLVEADRAMYAAKRAKAAGTSS
jgi:GGDEF domain-containing protein